MAFIPIVILTAVGGTPNYDVKFRVVEEREGEEVALEREVLIIVGASGSPTIHLKTNESGELVKSLPAGGYTITARLEDYGPPATYPNPVVRDAPIYMYKVQIGSGPNLVRIVMARRNPRINIHVKDTLGHDLAGAAIKVVGLHDGSSDVEGLYRSIEAAYGDYQVTVEMLNYYPQNQAGPRFDRMVGLTKDGCNPDTRNVSWDIDLKVVLGQTAPTNLPPVHVRPIAVWVGGGSSPHTTCETAAQSPPDNTRGQSGWTFGLIYGRNEFDRLSRLLGEQGAGPGKPYPDYLLKENGGPIQAHQISRLAIVAHGDGGLMDLDQVSSLIPAAEVCYTWTRRHLYASRLLSIGRGLSRDAVVYMAACRFAKASEGERLLCELSMMWPTCKVVGIRTYGTTALGAQDRKPSGMWPGVRDSNYAGDINFAQVGVDTANPAIWNDLNRLPWISETSTHATVAQDGNIIRRGKAPTT